MAEEQLLMPEDLKEENAFLHKNIVKNVFITKVMRLNSPKDFRNCFTNGKKIKSEVFVLHYLNNGGNLSRLGVSVAKNKIKKAVERNRIKGIAREIFRISGLMGLDIVLLLKYEKNYDQENCYNLINEIFNKLVKNESFINKNN